MNVITTKYMEPGDSVTVNRGYGLLIVSNISLGRTGMFLVQAGSVTTISDSILKLSFKRFSEWSFEFSVIGEDRQAINAVFIGLNE